MDWMADTLERRSHPNGMWPGARSAIMLGLNYGPDRDPLEALAAKSTGAISVYAQGDDYHDLIKKRLKALARWIVANHGGELKVFVDTAPLMEKPLAARAGLGWQGKHTNLVSREFGSWLFLGAILTGVFAAPSLGGTGIYDYVANAVAPEYSIGGQVWIQFQAVLTTIIWSGIVAFIAYKITDMVVGLRVTEEEEREGLDITSHGETAYHS
jgi:hypothetical protein